MDLSLAQAYRLLTHHDEAVEHFDQAVATAAWAGWQPGEAAATGSLANLGAVLVESGNTRAKALVLIGLSRDRLAAGGRAEAHAATRTALDAARRDGYRLIEEGAAAALAEPESPDLARSQPVSRPL